MDAIAPPIQALLDLFTAELRDVRFGDMDATTLASHAAGVDEAARELASAQALVEEARSRLTDRQETLLHHANRALAYARVYADTNTALVARLDSIALPRTARRTRAGGDDSGATLDPQPLRPRGRPRKVPRDEPLLAASHEATAE